MSVSDAKAKKAAYDKARYHLIREKKIKAAAEWKKNNREAVRKSNREWERRNKDKMSAYYSQWSKDNKGKRQASKARRRARECNATVSWADKEAIERMYKVSAFLTHKLGEPHHVDHIVPLQGKNVCGFHVEYNLQVITATENLKKANKL